MKENYENGKLQDTDIVLRQRVETVEETWQFDLITGTVRNYYETGELMSTSEYRASRQHGPYTAYWPNGKIKEQGEFVANKRHKEWKEFDERGNLVKTTVFKAGIVVEEK